MRNAMNIYKRKDGRYEGRIPIGYDENGKIKYRYLYSKNLFEFKEKMLISYVDLSNSSQNKCGKTFKELCKEWLASTKIRVKRSEEYYILSGTSKPVKPRTMQNRFKAVLKNCGIRNANFHLLHHTYATMCIENGFDAKTVSELLGHSNVNITLNRIGNSLDGTANTYSGNCEYFRTSKHRTHTNLLKKQSESAA